MAALGVWRVEEWVEIGALGEMSWDRDGWGHVIVEGVRKGEDLKIVVYCIIENTLLEVRRAEGRVLGGIVKCRGGESNCTSLFLPLQPPPPPPPRSASTISHNTLCLPSPSNEGNHPHFTLPFPILLFSSPLPLMCRSLREEVWCV